MSGAPRDAYAPRKFIIISLTAVKALGSWEAAGCFQRIAWRCERDGYWRATMQEIADEVEVSVRTAKRITDKLRTIGWVTGERENKWEATLTWRVIFEDESATESLSDGEDETAGQDSEGLGGTSESATESLSGVRDEAPSGSTPVAPTESANQSPSLFSETFETSDETSDDSSDDPTPQRKLSVVADGASSTPTIGEVAERLCQHLADRIEQNGSKRPTITQKWRDEARRMIEIDDRTERQVHNMIEWCQKSSFWCSNIMSMPTLRAKYDQMRLQAEQEMGITGKSTVYRRPADDPDELAARSVIG